MTSAPHIVRKTLFELRAHSAEPLQLHRHATTWARDRLLPELAEIFSSLPEVHGHVTLDRLEIHVEADARSAWTEQALSKLRSELIHRLTRTIAAETEAHGERRSSSGASFLHDLASYLASGVLPWTLDVATPAELHARVDAWLVSDDAPGSAPALAQIWRRLEARERFLLSFPAALITRLLIRLFAMPESWVNGTSATVDVPSASARTGSGRTQSSGSQATVPLPALHEVLAALSDDPRFFRRASERELWGARVRASTSPEAIATRAPDAASTLAPPEEAHRAGPRDDDAIPRHDAGTREGSAELLHLLAAEIEAAEEPTPIRIAPIEADPTREGIYARNAGLVLLAPFLERLFQRLELSRGNALVDPATAVCLLHFLCTAQEAPAEFEVPLAKVLCGLRLEGVLALPTQLPDRMKTEAQELLAAAIGHWSILKNTSVDGLRESFLQRRGKLSRRESGDWLLEVEQKAWDVLLGQLPWSFQLVRLPWMRQALWTEWHE